MSYEPLHHKYRPQTFAQLVGQEAVATTLTNALRQQRIAPAYLFTGARGTGKTSSARILAKSLNCLSADAPTAQPCGKCEVCRSIANGSSLDVIEIDAASNTGVDNIRELIERSQFAPVQCRYKVYVVDECLTGDSLVLTSDGLVRIDDPSLAGKKVLSYNDASAKWEFKSVVRWLDRGERQTYVIRTSDREIRCTGNHLIRTEQGWIAARELKSGMKILSPVSVAAAPSSRNLEPMVAVTDLAEGINLRETPTGRNHTTWQSFLSKLNCFAPLVLAVAVSNWIFQLISNKKDGVLAVLHPAGSAIPIERITAIGSLERQNFWQRLASYLRKTWDLSMEPYWVTAPSATQTDTVAFLDWHGRTESNSKHGWGTKQFVLPSCVQSSEIAPIEAMDSDRSIATQLVTHNFQIFSTWLNQTNVGNLSLWTGSAKSHLKDWRGGTWMMDRLALALKAVHKSSFIQKGTQPKKISSWLRGSLKWAIQLPQDPTFGLATIRPTATSGWEQMLPENGSQTSGNTPSHQWTTNLETIESVCLAGVEPVYDIEVEDNHNFVANGLLVHNCHMLSTAAFNALLKTLEEPPDRVIFVLATTDPQRVLPTIISRCQRFDFRRIPLEAMVMHLSQIADKEAIDITPEAIQLVAQISQGGLRDAEALLDQLSLLEGTITVERVWDLVGAVPERDLLALVKAIAVDDATTVLEQARRLMDRGREPLIVLQNLASFYRDLLIAKTSPDRPDLVAVTSPTWAEMTEFAQSLDLRTILQGQQRLRESEVQVKNTTQPRLWLEVTLMGLLPSSLGSSPAAIHGATAAPSINHRSSSPVIAQVTAPRQAATQTRSEASLPRTHVQASPQQANLQANPVDRSPVSNVKPQPESPSASSLPPEVISPVVQPEPEPIASLPDSPEPEPEPELNQADLEQIWQNVLAQIRFRGTQVLLQQQGCLLAFDGQQARIGIKSQPLFKMAKEKLPAIETAFAAIYEQRIVVSLEVTTAPPEPAAATEQQASTYTAPAPSAAPQRRSIVREAPPQPRETREPSPPSVPLPETAPAPFAEAESQSPVLNTAWKTDDEVSGAAKSLAMFFNGEIVNPDGEIVNPDSELSAEQRVDTTGLEVGEPDLDEIDGDPDDDVPF